MSSVFTYLLEVNLGIVLFLLAYSLFLGRQDNFVVKRIVLVSAIPLAIIFPLFHIATSASVFVPALAFVMPEPWFSKTSATGMLVQRATSYPFVIVWLYCGGVVFFLFRLLRSVVILTRILRRYPSYPAGRLRIIESTENVDSFSFFRFVFIGQVNKLSPGEREQILLHESAHAHCRHSLERVLMGTMGVIFWYNPLVILYNRLLIRLHEFEADALVIQTVPVNEYCGLLAKMSLLSAGFPLTSAFGHSLTLQRIGMLRSAPRKIRTWQLAALLLTVAAFFRVVAYEKSLAGSDGSVLTVAEQVPEYYQNGFAGLSEFISENMTYPAEARRNGQEGSVFTSFIVEENGVVSDIQTIKGISPSLDAEARRIVGLTQWIPGRSKGKTVRMRLILPVKFKLNEE